MEGFLLPYFHSVFLISLSPLVSLCYLCSFLLFLRLDGQTFTFDMTEVCFSIRQWLHSVVFPSQFPFQFCNAHREVFWYQDRVGLFPLRVWFTAWALCSCIITWLWDIKAVNLSSDLDSPAIVSWGGADWLDSRDAAAFVLDSRPV